MLWKKRTVFLREVFSLKKLVLIGAGGLGKEIASMVESINNRKPTYELLGFLDDGDKYHAGTMINGYPWLGTVDWALSHKDNMYYTCTIGDAIIKAAIQRRLSERGVAFETIMSPWAGISNHSSLGPGCILYRNAAVSVNCVIGAGVLLNDSVTIGHDTVIGDFTTIMTATGISGGCQIGSEVSIGGHAFVVPNRKIGSRAVVAAGSIVFTNVKEGTTVLGNPARRMKAIED